MMKQNLYIKKNGTHLYMQILFNADNYDQIDIQFYLRTSWCK